MRVKLSTTKLAIIFTSANERGYTSSMLASTLGVHERTFRDWRRGKFLMPLVAFQKLLNITEIPEHLLSPVFIDERLQRKLAGEKGGVAYTKLYGAPGTHNSRRKGGNASFERRKMDAKDIYARKAIQLPTQGLQLAEFMGIMIGDGSVGTYQASVSLNAVTDEQYSYFVVELIEKLFAIKPSLQHRIASNCTVIVISSIELTEQLQRYGLPKGDKIRAAIDIPSWILKNPALTAACLRGIFDTDGSIFLERHRIKDSPYAYPRMAFVSASPPLVESIHKGLTTLGIYATRRGQRKVTIERFTDIDKYFKIVSSSNPKHLERYALFGGVG